jgi:1,4-dihydroxy-6-naphthoate synthase
MNFRLAISPCPNDTFLFEGLVENLREGGGSVQFLDIAELNALSASDDPPDVIKVSCASVPLFLPRFRILRCGGAFADAVGPLVLSRPQPSGEGVLLPGWRTSAHILWRLWCESTGLELPREEFDRFDRIPSAVAQGKFRHGVVIHESRFTYQDLGLQEVVDLGKFWDEITRTPVPLGCLVVRADRGEAFAHEVARSISSWAQTAMDRADPVTPFVSSLASEMAPEVQRLHIQTYATRRSIDCGAEGLAAMSRLWEIAEGISPWAVGRLERERALEQAVAGME